MPDILQYPWLLGFQVIQAHTAPGTQAVTCLFDPSQEAGIVFQPIIEPIILRFESDQHASRFAMACDNDLLRLCFTEKPRQVILDLG